MKKNITVFFLIICFAAALMRLAYASASASFDDIYKKALSINSGMKDCQSDINIKINAKWYMGLRFGLTGKYYFKAPDKLKLDLKRTPSFLKKYPQVFSWTLPSTKDFNAKITGEESVDNNDCYVLFLTPKQPWGDLESHTIWIDKKEFIMRKQMFKYTTDSDITISQYYNKLSGYWVFNNLSAVFNFPKINLNATVGAVYENYKFNQNLPDSLFEQK